ncbi:hypothetical protein ACRALDRAFT_2026826 [Sodiomyces alcalophilus JCM 7366]|uniref:uncharacterized protein n=1 Tax=Sodiomyces alcalophilus JCM 7366 TaxID=591952 RepID=UPI0039B697A1
MKRNSSILNPLAQPLPFFRQLNSSRRRGRSTLLPSFILVPKRQSGTKNSELSTVRPLQPDAKPPPRPWLDSTLGSHKRDSTSVTRQVWRHKDHRSPPLDSYPTEVKVRAIERAAVAKIFFETYYNELLDERPTSRSVRLRNFRDQLDDNPLLRPEARERLEADFFFQESAHLRKYRALQCESLKAASSRVDDGRGPCSNNYTGIKILGKGSFGVVKLVRETHTHHTRSRHVYEPGGKLFAMKVIKKTNMIRSCQEGHLRAERDFLIASEASQWVVPLIASFQDATNLYLVMDYMPGGDFLGVLIRENILEENVARHYIAEMIVCVEEAHRLGFIHRDVKPDNFLIDARGHLKISDFGLAFDGRWPHDK